MSAHPANKTILNPRELNLLSKWGISFDIYESQTDGTLVIHIDTTEEKMPCNSNGPHPLRIYINDGEAYTNPPCPIS